MTSKSLDPSETGMNWAPREVAESRSRGQAGRDERRL
jgi:hypothetical protein